MDESTAHVQVEIHQMPVARRRKVLRKSLDGEALKYCCATEICKVKCQKNTRLKKHKQH